MAQIFTIANIGDLTGGIAVTAAATPFTQTLASGSIICTVAAAASIILVPSLFITIGSTMNIVDGAGFAGRPGANITITIQGGGTIQGLANAKITQPSGALTLMFMGLLAFQIIAHQP